ncbi:hypothetical protein SETIT_9G350800v2 [Setaria italica]|uniref:AP2/ERF domain-containing protein n=1 Tax=Setaria italica TaxID=4555 RepID=K4AKR8_SETIT|nr:hypothetical protein SETIT_9G350800v2 [Setaria italica]
MSTSTQEVEQMDWMDGDGDAVAASPRARTSSRYKGVVPQPNGRWGAQIYERHARAWLGTFADEAMAARAYDVAALRFRGRGRAVNFLGSPAGMAKIAFLAVQPKAEMVPRVALFEKALQAEKHFPPLDEAAPPVLLVFEDVAGGKVWRFWYLYWSSS